MDTKALIGAHPELYHMADPRNLASILRRGLLSTSALLDLFEINGRERFLLESVHRPNSVTISNPALGMAVIRDQKPMSASGVERSLTDATVEEFFQFLNGRVFFWLTIPRLITMNTAAAYSAVDQIVMVVDTRSLIASYEGRIRLSPMNSGATKPMAHPRSIAMFKPISEFEWSSRRPKRNRVVELTVEHSIPDVMSHVTRLEVWRGGRKQRAIEAPYETTKV